MRMTQEFLSNEWYRQIVPYQTWGYFMKDLHDAYKKKLANLSASVGSTLLLQALLLFIYYVLAGTHPGLLVIISLIGLGSILFFFRFCRKLAQDSAPVLTLIAAVSEGAVIIAVIAGAQWLPLFLALGLGAGFIGYGAVQTSLVNEAPPLMTDQEFDTWVERKAREGLSSTLRKLGLMDEIHDMNNLLCVRGYVLPGMRKSRYYNNRELLSRRGVDGRWRYSVNIYTYFYAAEHQIMIFIYDINAMNWADYREVTREYFYQDVIGATTEDELDTVYINGALFNYRDQRFSLRLCDGFGIGATVRSVPLDDIANLPTYDMPNSGVDNTIAQLRMLLRSKKWRPV